MIYWGAVLMLVGALSFLLPMLDRQFVVVSLLSFTGLSSTEIGFIFIGGGAYLFHLGKEQDKAIEEAAHAPLRERGYCLCSNCGALNSVTDATCSNCRSKL